MQEFNRTTTESYFIKNLLYSTYLPQLRTVREDDYIIKDRLYIYKCKIIRCKNSGYIPVQNANMDLSQPLHDDYAEFEVIGEYEFGEKNGKLCTNFLSSSEGYDYKTHERLGRYLRNLRDMYGLNLMPLYNCFSNQPLNNIHIYSDKIKSTSENFSTKVFKVPIRFNTTYTICMENVGQTTFAPAFIRHGTLLSLNNTKYGNGVDVTNKYISLNHSDVIHKVSNLRFKHPITLRFDNVPKNKTIHYSRYAENLIPAAYDQDYYRLNSSATNLYIRDYVDNAIIRYDYDNPDLEPIPVYGSGYKYKPDDGAGGDLLPHYYDDFNETKSYLVNDEVHHINKYYKCIRNHTGSWVEADFEEILEPEDDLKPADTLIPTGNYSGYYESINPSTGIWEDISFSFKACPDDETFFNKTIFDSNKTKYYTYNTTTNTYVQCTSSSIYNPLTQYSYKHYNTDDGWYEKDINGNLVKTQDTHINVNKTYYRKEKTEVPSTYNYDITEYNCSMYDYVEDELYLLIEVPSVFDSNIVILEGDYTDNSDEKIYDNSKLELFSNSRLDKLFTSDLKLMNMGTSNITPYSDTLIQFLLWHAICGLDSINNDMDRLSNDLQAAGEYVTNKTGNYWYSAYREAVYNYANKFSKKYITDNLGYVTTDIEDIILKGPELIEAKLAQEIIDSPMEEE